MQGTHETPIRDARDAWLLPVPRSFRLREGVCRLPARLAIPAELEALASRLLGSGLARAGIGLAPGDGAGTRVLKAAVGDSARDEAYALSISPGAPGSIELCASGFEGARRALATLGQLILRFGGDLPAIDIEDAPAIGLRGVMLDVSRDRVPTMESLRATIDRMERLKLNHLQLYTEHTFAYRGHEEVWRDASPITPEEARALARYGSERGVEVAANQNCFGHLHRWFRLPRYAPLAEIPPDIETWTFESDDGRAFTKSGPHSLCPTDPCSIALVDDLLSQLLPCFDAPMVNIGCDEAFDVGQGRSREAVARLGRAAVYFDHLRSVDSIVRRLGKRSLFWADIAWRHPDLLHLAPEASTPLVWGYEGDSFDRLDGAIDAMRRVGMIPWFCPGTSSWLSITGRTTNRTRNLREAARRSASIPGAGFLCCDWGDRGHRQQWPIAAHALAHAAHEAWTGGDAARPFDPRGSSLHVFDDQSGAMGPWLQELGDVDAARSARAEHRNTNSMFQELHRPLAQRPIDASRHGTLEEWQDILRSLESLGDRLEAMPAALDRTIRREVSHAQSVARHAAEKAVLCRACLDEPGGLPRAPARIRLAASLGALLEEHRELWMIRCRPGGLDDSCAHDEAVIDDYEHAEARA